MSAEVVNAQLECLRHRGPDAEGTFIAPGAVIGQSRLAVIDLETGDPPITSEDDSIGAVLNGEIYNFQRLRDALLATGHVMRTRGDTEVLVHLAEQDAPVEIARRLQGMFAFAIWDAARERLILGRDRLGVKPLYYCVSPDLFVFASEIKGLLAHPRVPRVLDPTAIPAYLAFGYVPTPRTFFAGIRSLPPGHVLTVGLGSPPRLEPYWEPPVPGVNTEVLDLSPGEAGHAVRRDLEEAIDRRLLSDVPVGAFLSGGIDSSAIVAIMSRRSPRPVKTFTIGFDDDGGFDERAYARQVATHCGTEHHEFVVAPDAVELTERLVWHHDQPFGDSSAIPTYLLNEFTGREVTVALSGDGGDELFAGYERFSAGLAASRFRALPPSARGLINRTLALASADALGGRVGSLRRFGESAARGLPDAYQEWLVFFSEDRRRRLLAEPDDWALRDYADVWQSSAGADTLDRLLNLNLRTYLLDDLLVKADRMSMAHGLEVRSPFLDTQLLDVALRLPAGHHVRGFARKRVLKGAVADLLPREIVTRRKRGFGVPLDRWFRGELGTFVDSVLGDRAARVKGHLSAGEVDALLEQHRSGAGNHGQRLWALLTLELFLRRQGW